jgi:hypothetical protein
MSARIRRSCFVPTLPASASRHLGRARSGLLDARTSGRGVTIDRVGAWGPAIFSDDTTSDIRSDYREMLEDQVPDEEATRRVIEAYGDLGADEEHLLWLALAAPQTQLGRLDAEVKARALDVIDSGRGLDTWEEAGVRELTKRKAVLAKTARPIDRRATVPQGGSSAMARPTFAPVTSCRSPPATATSRCFVLHESMTTASVPRPSWSCSIGAAGPCRLFGG